MTFAPPKSGVRQILAWIASSLFWYAGAGVSLPLLWFVVGMAIAGPGRRLAWSAVSAATGCVFLTVAALRPHLPSIDGHLLLGVLAFGVGPVLPALPFWVAHRMRKRAIAALRAGSN